MQYMYINLLISIHALCISSPEVKMHYSVQSTTRKQTWAFALSDGVLQYATACQSLSAISRPEKGTADSWLESEVSKIPTRLSMGRRVETSRGMHMVVLHLNQCMVYPGFLRRVLGPKYCGHIPLEASVRGLVTGSSWAWMNEWALWRYRYWLLCLELWNIIFMIM